VDIVQLRLTTGSDYQDDLAALRDTIRRNGTRATRHAVDLVIDDDAGAPRVSLLLNLAWQAAKNGPAVDASLYTLGFVGQSGMAFVFDIRPFPGGTPTGATALGGDGSYGWLGYATGPLPAINPSNLHQAVWTLSKVRPADASKFAPFKPDLTRLVIALSEALRFARTAHAIAGLLDGTLATYAPNDDRTACFNNWAAKGFPLGDPA
jgi:hypothetical protein